jgi:phenylacetate-CoA ligase
MIFTYHPARTFIEVADADPAGYGRLTISMLDTELPIPLMRYQTGDVVRRLDPEAAAEALQRWGLSIAGELPEQLLALEGRDRERLPNGSHVAVYKDALYADHEVAHQLTGAFRVAVSGERSTLHVQLTKASTGSSALERRLLEILPAAARPAALVLWPYERFPYGMSVDYERKFAYYVPEP